MISPNFAPRNNGEQTTMAMTEDRDITNAINTARKEAKEEGMERGIAEGMEKGLAEGMEKAHYETARKMKAKGFDSKEIAELTGLTEQEIERFR